MTASNPAWLVCSSCEGAIGNYVWNDANKNGKQDAGEMPLSGVTVNISGPNGYSKSMQTDALGFYQFTDLCPGTYEVSVVTPAGYASTPVCFNTQNTDFDANCSPQTVVSNNDTNNTIDFGFYLICEGKIGNYVWNDANKNGMQDAGEMPLSGVTVNITGPNGYSKSMQTDALGFYQYTGLCPGTYEVSVVTPAGYASTPGFFQKPNPRWLP